MKWLLLFVLVLAPVVVADFWDEGTTFTPETSGVVWTVSPNLTSTDLVVDQYCVNVTGGNRSGSYCSGSEEITLYPCLSQYNFVPTNGSSKGVQPTGQEAAGCSFNVSLTESDLDTVEFQMKYNGTLAYTVPDRSVWDFSKVFGYTTINEPTWVNTTYSWTRTCMQLAAFSTNKTDGPSSTRVTYRFNNSADNEMDYYNGSHFIEITTTWGCASENWFNVSLTQTNYSQYSWENLSMDYLWLSGGKVNLTLNTSTGAKTVEVNDSTGWKTLTVPFSGSSLTDFEVKLSGRRDGRIAVDNLRLNTSFTERKVDWLVGNSTYAEAVNLTAEFQPIMNVSKDENSSLLFWFNYFDPVSGVVPNFLNLWFNVSSTGGGVI